jgi:hypothetical protein
MACPPVVTVRWLWFNRVECGNARSGWNEQRVRDLIAYYDNQTEEEQVAEQEAAYEAAGQSMIGVPTELVPEIRALITRRCGV